MKMEIMSVKAEIIRLKLKAPEDFMKTLMENPQAVDQVCNGVGSEESITYHFTPDTNWGLNMNPASHIHDWMYKFPLLFKTYEAGMKWKALADRLFYENMCKQIKDGCKILQPVRYRRAKFYYECVDHFGEESFWAGKELPADWPYSTSIVKAVAA